MYGTLTSKYQRQINFTQNDCLILKNTLEILTNLDKPEKTLMMNKQMEFSTPVTISLKYERLKSLLNQWCC